MILYAVWISQDDMCLLSEDELTLMLLWARLNQIEFVGRDIPRSLLPSEHDQSELGDVPTCYSPHDVGEDCWSSDASFQKHSLHFFNSCDNPSIEPPQQGWKIILPIWHPLFLDFTGSNPCHVRLHVPQLTLTRVKWRCRKHFEAQGVSRVAKSSKWKVKSCTRQCPLVPQVVCWVRV